MMTTPKEAHASAVACPRVHLCDCCHNQPGRQFVDVFWLCDVCAPLYVKALETERD
jgi:hypothetical protein